MNLECTSDVQDDQRRERTTREEKKKGNRYLNRSGIKMDRRDGERPRERERRAKGKGHCRSLSTLKTVEDEKWWRVGGRGHQFA